MGQQRRHPRCDRERIRQIDIKRTLDAKARAFIKTALKGIKGIDPARYAVPYGNFKFIDPKVGYSVGNPVKITLSFDAEVPKAPGDEPLVEGAMTVLLETSSDKISAKVLNVGAPKKQLTSGKAGTPLRQAAKKPSARRRCFPSRRCLRLCRWRHRRR